jgi:hypothetical protein
MLSVKRLLGPLVPRRGSRLRVTVATALLLGGAAFFLWFTNRFYPLRHWLFWHYARAWLVAGFFSLACLSAGLRLLGYVLPGSLRLGERLVWGFGLGVLAFFWGAFLAGLGGLYGHAFFYVWPMALFLFGGRKVLRLAVRSWVHLRRFGARLLTPRGPIELLAALLAVLSLTALYLALMNPGNIGADANSYHIPIAEHYVAAGKIRAFADGWYGGVFPHLTSILYAWALQAPGSYSDNLAGCTHLEWALFLATLGGVAVLAGRLMRGRRRLPFAGAAIFLFPGIYLYDSNLIAGADHVLGFWAAPLALALLRLGRQFSVPNALLAGALSAAPMLTKLQGVYLFVPAALFVAILWVRARRMKPLLAWGLAGLVLSSAFWLRNWVFYGDPLYPLLHRYFHSHPFHAGAAPLLDRVFGVEQFVVTGTPAEKLVKTLKALGTFSFKPNDWGGFHGDKPVFGSLFTLLIPVLLFLRAPRRLWVLVVGTHLAIAVWYVTNHQDRYLQAILPWMAACTAAALALGWQQGPFVRTGITALSGCSWCGVRMSTSSGPTRCSAIRPSGRWASSWAPRTRGATPNGSHALGACRRWVIGCRPERSYSCTTSRRSSARAPRPFWMGRAGREPSTTFCSTRPGRQETCGKSSVSPTWCGCPIGAAWTATTSRGKRSSTGPSINSRTRPRTRSIFALPYWERRPRTSRTRASPRGSVGSPVAKHRRSGSTRSGDCAPNLPRSP